MRGPFKGCPCPTRIEAGQDRFRTRKKGNIIRHRGVAEAYCSRRAQELQSGPWAWWYGPQHPLNNMEVSQPCQDDKKRNKKGFWHVNDTFKFCIRGLVPHQPTENNPLDFHRFPRGFTSNQCILLLIFEYGRWFKGLMRWHHRMSVRRKRGTEEVVHMVYRWGKGFQEFFSYLGNFQNGL